MNPFYQTSPNNMCLKSFVSHENALLPVMLQSDKDENLPPVQRGSTPSRVLR